MTTDAGVPSLQRYTINKGGLLAYAATFAPGIFQVRRTTWVAAGIGLLALVAGLIWAAVILLGWLVGMAQTAPDAALRTLKQVEEKIPTARERLGDSLPALAPVARGMLDRLEEITPGIRSKLDETVPVLKPAQLPQRDVSGTDLGPVARYPGSVRTLWQREGAYAIVEYEGTMNYAAVLDYYIKGFATQGFVQNVLSTTQNSETHEYTKGPDRITFKATLNTKGLVSVRLQVTL